MTPGIYEYLSADSYHSDFHGDPRHEGPPSLSASIAHVLLSRSPAHARHRHPRLNPDWQPEDEAKYDVGKACHQILLEGNANVVVIPHDSYRTNAAKEAREFARTKLMTPLLEHEYERALEMCEAVTRQLAELAIDPVPFTVGKPEVTLVWQEPNGVACRARVDWLHEGNAAICDLKTTSRSANPDKWTRGPLYDHGCDIQCAFYLRGLRALTGVDAEWRWIVTETAPPYALSVISPDPSVIALGNAKVDEALRLWSECLESGEWPAYPRRVCWAQVPGWLEAQWLEREARQEAAA